jgi:hypothetical protein
LSEREHTKDSNQRCGYKDDKPVLQSTGNETLHGYSSSPLVKEFIASQQGRIAIERLPAYAPELNPVEYLWAHLKRHELPNVCAKDLWSLGDFARKKLKRMCRRKPLLLACWQQSSLLF